MSETRRGPQGIEGTKALSCGVGLLGRVQILNVAPRRVSRGVPEGNIVENKIDYLGIPA